MTASVLAAVLLPVFPLAQEGAHPTSPIPRTSVAGSWIRGEVSDPIGDATFDPRIAVSPDLRSGTAEVSSDKRLTLTVRLAPGTYAQETTFVQLSFDLDDSTEPVAAPDRRCGEFLVDIGGLGGVPSQATVSRLTAGNRYEVDYRRAA